MELRDLRCFIAIAEELSFTRAANRMRMAQPALSHRLRQFEEQLGAQLFARTKRKVALSEAGLALLPFARQVLGSMDEAVQAVRMVGAGHSGVLRIGAFYSAIYTVLPQIIRIFAAKYPGVEIQIREMIVSEQIRMLRDGAIDVGVVRFGRPQEGLDTLDLLDEEFLCALHVDHLLTKRKTVSLRQLDSEPLITLDPEFNSDFYASTLAAFASQGLSPRIVRKAPDMHLVLGLVSAGLGTALVPSSLSHIKHEFVQFRPLREKLPRMKMQLAWRARTNSRIVPNFVKSATATATATATAAALQKARRE